MNQNEAKLSKEEQKAKIRERYRGHVSSDTVVIPGKPQADIYDDTETKRVAVYARVSTDNVQQTSSYELQKNYYEDQVKRHPNWILVGIYPDEGISGTSLQHRAKFNQMIADCRAGKIDLIITKSVSRFARNIVDCISLVRELASLNPPVGVFFESENIFTLKDNTEMSLSFVATMAQEESHIKSTIMNASIEMRFGREIYLTPVLLGYDHDEDGNLVINEEEANTVRLIFFMYLYGYTCQEIADTLTQLGRKTKKGNVTWSASSVLQQLRNERHCGALLARKTFTPHYLDHKSKKNTGERTQYYKKHHHEGIISYDDFIAVQHLIDNARYGNKGILPELQVIPEGALKGFVVINPRWAGFQAADYEVASESVYENEVFVPQSLRDVEAQSGDFDLRGYEIARVQFFDTQNRISVSLSNDYLLFSTACIRKFNNAQYVEMLIHPHEHLLAVRKCEKDARNAIKWAKLDDNGNYGPRHISGAAFISAVTRASFDETVTPGIGGNGELLRTRLNILLLGLGLKGGTGSRAVIQRMTDAFRIAGELKEQCKLDALADVALFYKDTVFILRLLENILPEPVGDERDLQIAGIAVVGVGAEIYDIVRIKRRGFALGFQRNAHSAGDRLGCAIAVTGHTVRGGFG